VAENEQKIMEDCAQARGRCQKVARLPLSHPPVLVAYVPLPRACSIVVRRYHLWSWMYKAAEWERDEGVKIMIDTQNMFYKPDRPGNMYVAFYATRWANSHARLLHQQFPNLFPIDEPRSTKLRMFMRIRSAIRRARYTIHNTSGTTSIRPS